MEKRDALRLSQALSAQLERRLPVMVLESLVAENLIPKRAIKFRCPPQWALQASKASGKSMLSQLSEPKAKLSAKGIGSLVGFATTWHAFLSEPNDELKRLEKKIPEFAKFRQQFLAMFAAQFKSSAAIELKVPMLSLPARELAEFNTGRAAGSAALLDEDGELRGPASIKEEICYFLWLYWEQIEKLSTATELMKFLREFHVDDMSQRNLEKICRDLGLRFKSRGRPRKPTSSKRK